VLLRFSRVEATPPTTLFSTKPGMNERIRSQNPRALNAESDLPETGQAQAQEPRLRNAQLKWLGVCRVFGLGGSNVSILDVAPGRWISEARTVTRSPSVADRSRQIADQPLSEGKITPLTFEASSAARKAIPAASSSGVATCGITCMYLPMRSGKILDPMGA
jgi:hypothetical protein